MNTPATVSELLRTVEQMLADAGIESSADAELLLAHVLGESRGRVQALSVMGTAISDEDRDSVLDLASERARRVPLQHLTGRGPFRDFELEVGPGVFVPRPETEVVAQYAIDALRDASVNGPEDELIAVDLCTGSGALAIALAREVSQSRVWAVEKSPEAHAWSQRNVDRLGEGRVTLLLGDVADGASLLEGLLGRVSVLVSNPPYVPEDCVPRDPEVRDHDPALALYGGPDGLDLVRVISALGLDLVLPGGAIVLEHAESQGASVRALLAADGWAEPVTHPDLTGRDRLTLATR